MFGLRSHRFGRDAEGQRYAVDMLTDLRQYQALQETNSGYYFDEQGIAHGPRVTWSPLPENANQRDINPRSAILHTNGGLTPSTWQNLKNWLLQPGNNGECHFDVDNSGQAGQFMSVLKVADCNYSANYWKFNGQPYGAISFETGDLGHATLDRTPWNLDQLDTMIGLLTALAIQFGTGCNEVLRWDGAGIDYHTKFPYINKTIPAWTNIKGKTCPGKQRKLQLPFIRSQVADRVVAYINRCGEMGIAHGVPGI